jgi:acyl-CoA synthetase (AMP-forming)/AMP-acid ligase II
MPAIWNYTVPNKAYAWRPESSAWRLMPNGVEPRTCIVAATGHYTIEMCVMISGGLSASAPSSKWLFRRKANSSNLGGNLFINTESGIGFKVDPFASISILSTERRINLRRRGENISSIEVEKVVNLNPAVLESAAVGVKSEVGEDEVKIVVELKEGQKLTSEELIVWCEPRMAYFMVPRYLRFMRYIVLCDPSSFCLQTMS